ncbi:MAG: acyltransferase family protein [Myxococcales bacterium]|nr:acyltransferase family protein [Myxococcales bacterium]
MPEPLDILSSLAQRITGAFRQPPWSALEEELAGRLSTAPLRLNSFGYDPQGFHPDAARRLLLPSALLYRYYFRVETHGIENLPPGPVLLIANHAGQFAYDGSMLSMAMLLEADPPRLARGMGEYFLWRMPWVGLSAARIGTMVGTPENCIAMLEDGECVMAFPEGARGANKPFRKRYELQRFGLGFMRLALATGTPIVPVGIVGSEEQQPGFANLEDFGRRLGLPSFPITITQPWFGLLGSAAALPVKYHIHFGEPLSFEGDTHEEDAAVEARVEVVKNSMRALIARGLEERAGIFF